MLRERWGTPSPALGRRVIGRISELWEQDAARNGQTGFTEVAGSFTSSVDFAFARQ